MITLSKIIIYPIKSLAGVSLPNAILEKKGCALDRRWMLVDEEGVFLTQRNDPNMAMIALDLSPDHQSLTLRNRKDNNQSPIELLIQDHYEGQTRKVQVWDDICDAVQLGEEYSAWFSQALERPCHLVYMPDESQRPVNQKYADENSIVSFADAFPFLLASESSLQNLNDRLEEPVRMIRFRPNLVIEGTEAWEEDNWSAFRIGDAHFQFTKTCPRCTLLTINPETGEKGVEPLKTLSTFRKQGNKVLFGLNACWDGSSSANIKVGDELQVLA